MKVLQVASTAGQQCGVGTFAVNFARALTRRGVPTATVNRLDPQPDADLVIVHHGWQLFSNDDDVAIYCRTLQVPAVIFAHYHGAERFAQDVDGYLMLCPGVVGPTGVPTLTFSHPAWTPPRLDDRPRLKDLFGLPRRPVLGTSGFIAAHRRFPDILTRLLPQAQRRGWLVDLVTSSWYRGTGDLVVQLERIRREYPDHLRYGTSFLDTATLNKRLQACDLLWCWTDLPSTPYGSGSISDQYASGTRIVAADKVQHAHVLNLPNTVRASAMLDAFVDRLIAEADRGHYPRHDPAPLGWDHHLGAVTDFLHRIHRRRAADRIRAAAPRSGPAVETATLDGGVHGR